MPGVTRDGLRHRRTGVPAVSILRWFAWAAFAILVAEIVRANLSAGVQAEWPWKVRLLGISTAASLLAASLIALLARDQYARSVAPLLRYVSQWVAETDGLTRSAGRYRQVIVGNAGPGTAVVVSVIWRAAAVTERDIAEVTSPDALRVLLGGFKLADGADYTISNYSAGTALAPGEQRLYFECTDDAAARFAVFDAVFEFESLLGDRYVKTISLLPLPGASSAVTAPSAIAAA